MVPDKESVIRRYRRPEIFDWSLVIRRSITKLDQRLFAGQRVQQGLRSGTLRERARQFGTERLSQGNPRRSRRRDHYSAGDSDKASTGYHSTAVRDLLIQSEGSNIHRADGRPRHELSFFYIKIYRDSRSLNEDIHLGRTARNS